MKVSIGPYIDYIGPFQIAEKILFWKDAHKINKKNTVEVHKDSDDIYKLCEKLAKTKWLIQLCDWYNDRQKRKISVKLHPYDTWGVDNTLAFIITPILKKLKEDKNGASHDDINSDSFTATKKNMKSKSFKKKQSRKNRTMKKI